MTGAWATRGLREKYDGVARAMLRHSRNRKRCGDLQTRGSAMALCLIFVKAMLTAKPLTTGH
jgi:hypothetical protein